MPVKQVAMRKIKECLRLKWSCHLSHEQIAKALGLSKGVVSKYTQLATAAGLDWPTVAVLDETALQHLLLPNTPRHRGLRPQPDWLVIHREMHQKGITLQLLWEEHVEVRITLNPATDSTLKPASRSTFKPTTCSTRNPPPVLQ